MTVNGQLATDLSGTPLTSVLSVADSIKTGEWRHAAVSYISPTLKLYLDGAQVDSRNTTQIGSSAGTMVAGTNSAKNGNWFNGLLDHVVILKTALQNASAVQDLMRQNPVLNLHLDEDLAMTTFADDTPYTNHATCSGTTCPRGGRQRPGAGGARL